MTNGLTATIASGRKSVRGNSRLILLSPKTNASDAASRSKSVDSRLGPLQRMTARLPACRSRDARRRRRDRRASGLRSHLRRFSARRNASRYGLSVARCARIGWDVMAAVDVGLRSNSRVKKAEEAGGYT